MATLTGTSGNDFIDGTAASDTIDGLAGNDEMHGEGSADTVIGGLGNDSVGGGAGNDWLEGGVGNDTLGGSGDRDHFVFREFGAANADIVADLTSNWDDIQLDVAAFTQLGATGRFVAGDARFFAAAGASAGHDANDRIVFNTTTHQLFYDADGSGAGAAQLIATLSNGANVTATDITAFGTPAPSGTTINGSAGDDTLIGTDANETINGLGGNDSIAGAGGTDRLVGGDGNDTLNGTQLVETGTGFRDDTLADTLDGGLGNDEYIVGANDITVADPGGIDTVMAIGVDWTLGAGLENLILREPGPQVDGASGTGNQLNNLIDASGYDHAGTLSGLGGNDTLFTGQNSGLLLGGAGNDELHGHKATMSGGLGNDTIFTDGTDVLLFDVTPGAANADVVMGQFASFIQIDGNAFSNIGPSGPFAADDARFFSGAGATSGHDADDRVIYDTATGSLRYDADGNGPGAALLMATFQGAPIFQANFISVVNGQATPANTATEGNDTLVGTPGDDSINGLGGNDSISGLGGNDTLDGGLGVDTMDGGAGDDTYFVEMGDVVSDASGVDTVFSDAPFWLLGAGFENLTLDRGEDIDGDGNALANVMTGNAGANEFHGNQGDDTIDGGAGRDSIGGGAGNDWLNGGAGNDTLGGSGDRDHFLFNEFGVQNADLVVDLSRNWDDVRLDTAVFTDLGAVGRFAAGDARFFSAAGATAAHDATDRIVYNTTTGQLFYDHDGAGGDSAQLVATLQGTPALLSTDIWSFT